MNKIMCRSVSFLLAVCILFTGINFPQKEVLAEEIDSVIAEEVLETDNLEEMQEIVSELNEEMDIESEGRWASKRLIVVSEELFDSYGAEYALSFDGFYVLSYSSEEDCENAYKKLSENESVLSVEADAVMDTMEGERSEDDADLSDNHFSSLKEYLNEAEIKKEVMVAVLDTGVNQELLEMDEVVDSNLNLSNSGEVDSVLDDNGHGSKIAELVLLNGNEKTNILPIKIANQYGEATILSAYLGIKSAMEDGADVINISMNTKKNNTSEILNKVIDEASENGIAVVVSAGNSGIDTAFVSPSDSESAVVVSAVETDGSLAEYSNYGSSIDYCSYGDYNGESGTSYAAATVSGIFASLISTGIDLDEISEFAQNMEEEEFYGNGLLSYENIQFEKEDGENSDAFEDLTNESIVSNMRYVALNDEDVDIRNDISGISYDPSVYKPSFVSSEPEFDVHKKGDYEVTYDFVKDNGSHLFMTQTITVTDSSKVIETLKESENLKTSGVIDEDRVQNLYDLCQSNKKNGIIASVIKDSKRYTVDCYNEDYPSRYMSAESILKIQYIKMDYATNALWCATKIVNSDNKNIKWTNIYQAGKDLFDMKLLTNKEYEPNTGTAEPYQKYRRHIFDEPIAERNGYSDLYNNYVYDDGDTEDNILAALLYYEIVRKYGGQSKAKEILGATSTESNKLFQNVKNADFNKARQAISAIQDNTGASGRKVRNAIILNIFGNSNLIYDSDYKASQNDSLKNLYDGGNPANPNPPENTILGAIMKINGVDRAYATKLALLLCMGMDIVSGGMKPHELNFTVKGETKTPTYKGQIFSAEYNKFNGNDNADNWPTEEIKKGVTDGSYRIMKGWGVSYGEDFNYDAEFEIDFPDQREHTYNGTYGNASDLPDEKEGTYVGEIEEIMDGNSLRKKIKNNMMDLPMFDQPIHMYEGDTIFFTIQGKACSHVGCYGYIDVTDADNKTTVVGKLSLKGDEGDEDGESKVMLAYQADETGYYKFNVFGAVWACKYAHPFISTESDAEIFTDRYNIKYDFKYLNGNDVFPNEETKKTFMDALGNPEMYTHYTNPFTLNNPTISNQYINGLIFDGWKEVAVSNETNPAPFPGYSKSVTITPGGNPDYYGDRHYVAYFHQPRFLVYHEFEQLDGSYKREEQYTDIRTTLLGATVNTAPLSISGFTCSQSPQSTVVTADQQYVTYRYRRNSYNVTFKDINTVDGSILASSTEQRKYNSYVSASEKGSDEAMDAYYPGLYLVECTGIYVKDEENVVYRYFTDRPVYSVQHYLQNVDGTYPDNPQDIDVFDSPDMGTSVEVRPRTYNGFERISTKYVTINERDQVISLHYPRAQISVRCEDYCGNTKLGTPNPSTKQYPYGSVANGADFGDDTTIDAYYKGYRYSYSGQSVLVEMGSDLVVYRYFEEENSNYQIIHEYEQLDGSYGDTMYVYKQHTGNPGGKETAPLQPKTGYNSPSAVQVTRNTDGTVSPNPVIYRYTLKKDCTVTYIDRILNTETDLANPAQTAVKVYGETVSGSDIGSSATVGHYYPGYKYHSCTTEMVKESGTKVYRYFEDMNGRYTVWHFKVALDGTRTLVEDEPIETKQGIVGTQVTPPVRNYAGYISPQPQTKTILADGSMSIEYEYVLDADNIKAPYKAYHKVQNAEGSYDLRYTDSYEGTPGATATPPTRTISGYITPETKSVVISADGTSSVTYYYNRQEYDVTCIDIARDNGSELGRRTKKAFYQATVYGRDFGASSGLGAYYQGYAYESDTSDVVGITGATVYRYFTKSGGSASNNADYKVSHEYEQIGGTFLREKTYTLSGGVGTAVTPPTEPKAGYITPPLQEAVIRADGATHVIYQYHLAETRADYKVHHLLEQPSGMYENDETEFLSGMIGQQVTPETKNYATHISPDVQTGTVKADGSLEIKYYYRLRTANVQYIDKVKDTDNQLGNRTESKKIGTVVSGAEMGIDRTEGAYYDNYSYDSCTTGTVGTNGAVVYRYFTLVNAPYKVYHKQEQPNGSYQLVKTENLTGRIGMEVTPERQDYSPNYSMPEPKTAVIQADGSTEVTYLYDIARYSVTFIDKVKNSDPEEILGMSTAERSYGATVSGSEKGSDKTVGRYYTGYVYDSCTSETVRESGTTVYRYFTEKQARYTVNHIWESEDGARTTVQTQMLNARVGSTVTPAVNTYPGRISPQPQTVTVAEDGSTTVDYIYRIGNAMAEYTVEHKKELLSGKYEDTETERFSAEAGTVVSPATKDYDGFVIPPRQEITVNADGSSCVVYYYRLSLFDVTYVDMEKDTSNELGRTARRMKYGAYALGSDLGSNPETGAYYEGFAYDSCTGATVSSTGTIVYRYFVKDSGDTDVPGGPNQVDYMVVHQQEQPNGIFVTVDTDILHGEAGSRVTPPVRQYDGFVSPQPQTVTIAADGSTRVVYQYRIFTRNTSYTVIHQQESLDGSYVTVRTDNCSGIAGSQVTPPTLTFTGFTSPPLQTVTVAEDGSTTVIYRYGRNSYSIIYSDVVLDTKEELGRQRGYKKFRETASGSELGESRETGAYYEGYAYHSCTTILVSEDNLTVYRYFVKSGDENPDEGNTRYRVVHQQEQLDGSYSTVETEDCTGKAGETVTPAVRTYTGFVSPSVQTVQIQPDGNTVITYKYSRQRIMVRYVDQVRGTQAVLGETMVEKMFGETVSGSDLGNLTEVGRYYAGYAYHSCTSAVANKAGTTVYRYFTAKGTEYTVIHQKEQLDGTYATAESSTHTGAVGETVTPPVKSYTGFTSPQPQTITLTSDNVIIYQYRRIRMDVTYIDMVKDTDTELGRSTAQKMFGEVVMGSDLGSSRNPGAYYEGYVYDSCTIATVGVKGAVVYRYFVEDSGDVDTNPDEPKKVEYTVIHQKEQPNGSYLTADTEKLSGNAGELVTPAVKTYEGYTSPAPKTVTIAADGTTIVTYRYRIAQKNSSYTVIHKKEQQDGSFITEDIETFAADAGSSVTPQTKNYEGYISPSLQTVTVAADGSTVVVYRYTLQDKKVTYKVIHEQENPDGTYEIIEIEVKEEEPGTKVTPPVKDYEGFISPPEKTEIVNPDGSTTIIYRYERKRFKVSYVDRDESGNELGRTEEDVMYGTVVAGSDKGDDKTAGAYYEGLVYDSCTSATVTEDVEVYRNFVKDDGNGDDQNKPDDKPDDKTTYKVVIETEKPDGTYEETEIKEFEEVPGTEVSPKPEDKDGYVTPPVQTEVVQPDGSTVITYKYELEKYDVTYIDMFDGKEIGRTVRKKKLGTTAAGSELGEDRAMGAYYEGYAYDSCTTAVVVKSGTVVYRYFTDQSDEDTEYKVVIKEEQPDGTFKEVETEIVSGKPGDKVIVEPKPIDGFITPKPQEVIIKPDGSTTVVFEYERESYEVTYIDMEKDSQKELGRKTEKVKFGYTVSGSDKGSDRTSGAYYTGYTYDSCTSAVVEKSGTTVYRYFVKSANNGDNNNGTKEKAPYKVYHQEEQPDGSYKTVETDELTGIPGETVTVYPKPREGFKTPEPQKVVIQADGTAMVTFKYERKSYKVNYVDRIKGTNEKLGKSSANKKFGTTVSGADKGTDKSVGKYYKGYVYDSCTSATVSANGATVYRYFVKVNAGSGNGNQTGNNGSVAGNNGAGNGNSSSLNGDGSGNSIIKGGQMLENGKETDNVKTGDTSVMWIILAGAAFAAAGILLAAKKKNKER